MSSNKRLLKNSGIYGIVQVMQKAIGLIMMPIYTRVLSTQDKGAAEIVQSLVAFFAIVYTLSINAAIVRFYVDYKDDEKKLKDFWGTCLTFVLVNSVVISIILFFTRKFILLPLVKNQIDFFPYIFLGLISMTLNPIYVIFQSTLQAKEESKTYGKNNLVYFVLNLSLSILFVVVFRMGAVGVLLALALTDIVFFVYTVIRFFPKISLKIKTSYLVEALKYSLPLLPHNLSGWAVSMIDRLFLGAISGLSVSGIYGTAAQFGNVINVLTAAVNQAYVPWFFSMMKDKEKNEKNIINISEIIVIIYSFLAMGMSLFGPEIFIILAGPEYRSGWRSIPFLSFAFVFNGIYYFFVNPLFYNKRGVKFIAIGTFIGAIMNCILNYLLIPRFADVGAGLASLISTIISCTIVYYISIRIEKLNFNIIKMYSIAIIFFGVSLSAFLLQDLSFWISILIKSIIVIIIIVIILCFYRKEVTDLISNFRKRRQ